MMLGNVGKSCVANPAWKRGVFNDHDGSRESEVTLGRWFWVWYINELGV